MHLSFRKRTTKRKKNQKKKIHSSEMTAISQSGVTLTSCPVNYMLLFSSISGPSSHVVHVFASSGLVLFDPGGSLPLFDRILTPLPHITVSLLSPHPDLLSFLCLIISLRHTPLNLTRGRQGWACCLTRLLPSLDTRSPWQYRDMA